MKVFDSLPPGEARRMGLFFFIGWYSDDGAYAGDDVGGGWGGLELLLRPLSWRVEGGVAIYLCETLPL